MCFKLWMELDLLLVHSQKNESPFYCPNQLKTFYMFTQINKIKRNEKNVVSTWAQSWPLWKHIYVQWVRIWLYGVGRYEVGDDEHPKQHCSKDNTWMLKHQNVTTKIMNNIYIVWKLCQTPHSPTRTIFHIMVVIF